MKVVEIFVFQIFPVPSLQFSVCEYADIESKKLVLSAKYSLINSAHQLPSDISFINPQSIIHVTIFGHAWLLIMLLVLENFLRILISSQVLSIAVVFFLISLVHAFYCEQGYICNLIETGCFVRFLGRLTGFSPRSKVIYFSCPLIIWLKIFLCSLWFVSISLLWYAGNGWPKSSTSWSFLLGTICSEQYTWCWWTFWHWIFWIHNLWIVYWSP